MLFFRKGSFGCTIRYKTLFSDSAKRVNNALIQYIKQVAIIEMCYGCELVMLFLVFDLNRIRIRKLLAHCSLEVSINVY
jgi:hypothetical protein